MNDATKSLGSRIEWCRRQSTQARAPLERAGWQAEEEGLRDALLNKNHTHQYQPGSPCVFERYAMGLQYGREVLRTAAGGKQRGGSLFYHGTSETLPIQIIHGRRLSTCEHLR